jgi:ubiquinol-cytochrome c reductase cytochrome c1 subunit
MKTLAKSAARSATKYALGALCGLMLGTASAQAAEGVKLPEQDWSFDGVLGLFDRAQLQRGLQVYREVCAGCHGLRYIAFRNLADLQYNEDQIKAIASEAIIVDGPDDEGEMFEREGRLPDYFPSPFANDKAAAASNNGAVPPDLGHQIAMAQPLDDDAVEYADGTEASLDQMARDVAAFLTWTAEPKLEARKTAGIWVILFFLFVTGVTYASKKKIWADLHKDDGSKE